MWKATVTVADAAPGSGADPVTDAALMARDVVDAALMARDVADAAPMPREVKGAGSWKAVSVVEAPIEPAAPGARAVMVARVALIPGSASLVALGCGSTSLSE